jgi:valyl-tRNA synthetase
MASPGTDIAFSEARTEGYRAFANKIWNAARFLFMNIDRAKEAGIEIEPATNPGAPHLDSEMWVEAAQIPLETRWVLTRLSETCTAVATSLADYRFDEAANVIYQFFWGDLCDWYLEIVKLRLNFGENDDKQATTAALTTLVAVFEASLRLLSPFMPFITEEIWHALYNGEPPAKSIALTRYPKAEDFRVDLRSVAGMNVLQNLITTVRARRKDLGVPEKESVGIFMVFSNQVLLGSTIKEIGNVVIENEDILFRLAKVSAMETKELDYLERTRGLGWTFAGMAGEVAVLYERQIDVPAERERLTKDLAKYEKGLTAADHQLGNEAFMAKAPAHIVDGLRKQHAETRMLYDKTKAALEALGG